MENLPIDTSNPAVRDYLALARLQVLTPLSLLINIVTVGVCALWVNPSIAGVSRLHPTAITPNAAAISGYVCVIFLGQLGYCLLLVLAGKQETKRALVKGVGLWLVFANFIMALWAIAWIMQWFLFATILQGLLLLALMYSNIALLIYHPPDPSRPLDTMLIHAPLRFFLMLPLTILFALNLFVTLGLSFDPTPPGAPRHYSSWHAMAGFGVILGTNLLALGVVIFRRDFVLCIASTWIAISLWTARPKPTPIFVTAVVFTVLHPLCLLASMIYARFYRRNPDIQLPADNEHPGLYGQRGNGRQMPQEIERGPREIENDNTWG